MWTDIDYMDRRRVFSLDPDRFPIERMQELVHNLHQHDQHYMVMVDPAVAHTDYPGYNEGGETGMDVFLRSSKSDYFKGVVWPVRIVLLCYLLLACIILINQNLGCHGVPGLDASEREFVLESTVRSEFQPGYRC